MRYLPIVMGVSFIVVVKIIKNQTCAGRIGPWRGKQIGMPSCRGTLLIHPARRSSIEPQAGLLAIAGAKSTEGEKATKP